MKVRKTHRNSSSITRALIRLCVWLVVVSSTPVAAQANEPLMTSGQAALATVVSQEQASSNEVLTVDSSSSAENAAATSASDANQEDDTVFVFVPDALGPTPTPPPLVLPAPAVTAPVYGATTSVNTHPPLGLPTFSWEPIEGANYYEVQVSDDPGFSTLLPDKKAIETYAATYTLLKSLPDDEYYWRVRACIDRPKTCYEYSETQLFRKTWTDDGSTVPQLISPPQESVRITFTNDDFSWTPVLGAAKYLFELSADAGFGTSSIVYSGETLTNRHTPYEEKLENRTYYWRVTPIDNQGYRGEASEIGSFKLEWNVVPQLIAPINNAVLQFSPRFQWTAVEGARMYQLQVSTDADFGTLWGKGFNLPNTSANFRENLPNDQEFYWRVRGTDYWGKSTPWSEVRSFRMKWNFEAQLLAPPNDANSPGTEVSHFYLSWTPIPGAAKYQVQVDESDYSKPLMDETFYNVNSAALYKVKDSSTYLNGNYTWRVRGIDADGNVTPWSDEYPFQMDSDEVSPNPIYPPFYFLPDSINMPQYRDFTVAWPVFVWDSAFQCRTSKVGLDGPIVNCPTISPKYYELTVASDITFQTVHFKIRTRNNAVAPTLQDAFVNLQDGKTYYWKVLAYIANPDDVNGPDIQIGQPSVWIARYDRSLNDIAIANSITLMYPRNGFESVGNPPVLGWQPVQDAATYRVQIARDNTFQQIVDEAEAMYINYVPWQAHIDTTTGEFDDMPFGTYFWRVRAQSSSGTPIGDWSEVRYFNHSIDIITGNPYDVPILPRAELDGTKNSIWEENLLRVVKGGQSTYVQYDPSYSYVTQSNNVALDDYELGKLHLMLNRINTGYKSNVLFDNHEWILAFEVAETVSAKVDYCIYVDIDHLEGSGATTGPSLIGDASACPTPVNSRYLPEYALHVIRNPGSESLFSGEDIEYFSWDTTHSVWLPGDAIKTLSDNDGAAWFVQPKVELGTPSLIQILVPYEDLGFGETNSTGSMAITIMSIDRATGEVVDSIPDQDESFSNPLFVSDMPSPLYPFDTPLSNPFDYDDMPTFRWRMSTFDSIDGYEVEIARDPKFTDRVELWELHETNTHNLWSWLPHDFQSKEAYEDNESLYMRVRLRHERFGTLDKLFDYSAWSPYIRVKLGSRRPGNLRVAPDSPAWMTPTFSWDRVDGASGYTLQVDNDSNFTSPVIEEKVNVPSFTPLDLLPDGTYYWRVLARRSDKLQGAPSDVLTFTMRLVTPVPVAPIKDVEIHDVPTFNWQAVLTPNDIPRQSASRYKIELSNDAGFSKPFIFYSEANTFTPPASVALPAGTWYWRVGVLDWDNNEGSMSAVQSFKLSYPTVTLLGPNQGEQSRLAPEFSWQPVEGASYYELWIDTDPGFAKATKVKTDSSRYTPTAKFAPGNYFWQVRMYNDKDVPGAFQQGEFVITGSSIYLPIVMK